MPCWTWPEVEKILHHFPDYRKEIVQERYNKFGGILRYIFSDDTQWDEALDDAISSSNVSDIRRTVAGPDMLPSVSHKIFHYEITPAYRKSRILFASDYIADRVTKCLFENEKEEIVRFLIESTNESTLGTIRGKIFQKFAHSALCAGGKFRVRYLATKKKGRKPQTPSEVL